MKNYNDRQKDEGEKDIRLKERGNKTDSEKRQNINVRRKE